MGNAMRHWMGIVGWVVGMGALAAGAQPAGDATGVYKKAGGKLAIVQGDNETLVHYQGSFPQGESAGTCECTLVVKSKTATRWTLAGPDLAPGKLSLAVAPGRFVLEGTNPGCCGAGWSGRDEFSRAQAATPPASCKVSAPRVYFQATDEGNTQRKAYVVQGDTVEAYLPATEPDLVPARFKGKKTTAGLLQRTQLECAAAPAAAAPPAVKAEQLQPLAGKWVELTKKGKGYVIFKPCSAETRAFTLQPDGARMEIQLGQESTSVRVTKLEPGAGTGAYVLELTPEGGQGEQVEWKVTDAAKGIVSLTSPELFARSHTYVRDAKKGAFRVDAEKNCESEHD
ncbi:hypothetical protein [Cystobacter fuscus]|uniref:hypothetical protein n=1 Tax=Cystobacter fuscus TaxID=43 RepID=UPI002B317396|nr:hypothetical protein F0U63_24280 [Cystobacter fuscus]